MDASPTTSDQLLGLAGRLLAAEEDDVFDVAVAGIMEAVAAERGFLLLTGGQRQRFKVVRNWTTEQLSGGRDPCSSSIVQHVLATGQPILAKDAQTDPRFGAQESVVALRVRSVLAAPFALAGKNAGVLYLERRDLERHFAAHDLELFVRALSLCARQIEQGLHQLERRRQRPESSAGDIPGLPFEGVWPNDPYFRLQLETAARAARHDELPVLIQGPSGSGKELIARAIHQASRRSAGPFQVINCGAMPRNILESELFGHVRGAFTGAERDRKGLLTAADAGTVFLDEIGELPIELQPALLRALQFGEVRPIGSNQALRVDFRLVSATNRDLDQQVKDGSFREDLFYRINAFTIEAPPLRSRPTDILPLFRAFLEKSLATATTAPRLSTEARDTLLRYSWPGNVRELENEARRIAALCETGRSRIEHSDFSPRILNRLLHRPPLALDDAQRALVLDHLRYADGNRSRAAKTLGVSREGLRQMMERLHIDYPVRAGRPSSTTGLD